jgi:hypothetical protein
MLDAHVFHVEEFDARCDTVDRSVDRPPVRLDALAAHIGGDRDLIRILGADVSVGLEMPTDQGE